MGWVIALGILLLLAILPLGVSAKYDGGGLSAKVLAGPIGIRLYPRAKKRPDKKAGKESSIKAGKPSEADRRAGNPRPGDGSQGDNSDALPEHCEYFADTLPEHCGYFADTLPEHCRDIGETSDPPKTTGSAPSSTVRRPVKPPEKETKKLEKGGKLTDFIPLVKVGLQLLGDFRRKLRVNRLEVKLILAGDDPCDLAVNYGRIWAAVGNLMPKLESWLVIKKRDIDVQCDFTAGETLVIARLELTITLGRLISLGVVYGFRGLKEFLKMNKKRKGGAVK